MSWVFLLLLPMFAAKGLAASGPMHFEITDVRGKKVSGMTLAAGDADADGWHKLRISKGKPGLEIVWPFDSMVKKADGPGPIPVIVGDPNARGLLWVAAAAL